MGKLAGWLHYGEDDVCKQNDKDPAASPETLNGLTFIVWRKADARWKAEEDNTRNKEPKLLKCIHTHDFYAENNNKAKLNRQIPFIYLAYSFTTFYLCKRCCYYICWKLKKAMARCHWPWSKYIKFDLPFGFYFDLNGNSFLVLDATKDH